MGFSLQCVTLKEIRRGRKRINGYVVKKYMSKYQLGKGQCWWWGGGGGVIPAVPDPYPQQAYCPICTVMTTLSFILITTYFLHGRFYGA